MTKSGPASAASAGSYNYTLTVTNSGQTASASGVVVQDQLPPGMVATAATGASCAPLNSAGALLSCTLPSAVAANGGTATISLAVKAPAVGSSTSITNYASVDQTGGGAPPAPGPLCIAANCGSATTSITPEANLAISKTASPSGTYVPGQALNYEIVVINNGPSAVTGASVADSVPASVTVSSWSCMPVASCGTTPSGSGNSVSLSGMSLAAGASATIRISGTVQLSATGDIVNSATVTSTVPSSSCSTVPCTTSSNTTRNSNGGTPQLSIAKTATPAAFAVGQTGTYSIVVSNSGTSSTSGALTVSDTMPTGITLTSASGSGWICDVSATLLTCESSAVLLPGSNAPVINAQVSVAANAASSVVNTATVSGGGVTCGANCSSTITTNVNAPKLDVTKTLSSPFVVGIANNYIIKATNNGQAATLAGTITDEIPLGLTVGAMPAGCSVSGQTVTCSIAAGIATGGSVSFSIPVTPQASANGQNLSNTAVANPNTGDISCPAAAHCSGTTDNPVSAPQLTLTKQVSVSTFTVNVPAQYILTLSNTGTAATTATALVSDTVPAGLSIDAASVAAAGCVQNPAGSQTVECSVASLAVNASATFSLTVTPQSSANAQSVTNQATATGGGDPLCVAGTAVASLPARCAPAVTTAVNAPQLSLTKSAAGSFSVGVLSSYTLSVANTGTASTNDVITIIDVVPSSLTLGVLPAGCTATDQQVSCTIAQSLAVGAPAVSFVIPVTPMATASPSVSNTATVQGGGDPTCPTTANCSSSTTTAVDAPSLKLSKADNGGWVVGQTGATYSLTVSNTNASLATVGSITVQDSMPAGITAVSDTYGDWACTVSGQHLTCTSGTSIAGGAMSAINLPVTITAAAINSGTSAAVTNYASVAGGGDPYNGGTPPVPGITCTDADHCASKTTTVSTAASIATFKNLTQINGAAVPTGYQAQPGDVLQYTLAVGNSGGTVGSTILTETVPEGTTYTGGAGEGWDTTPSACTAAGSTCTKTMSVPANSSKTVTYTVSVNAPLASATISNLVASSAAGSCVAPNCAVDIPVASADMRSTSPTTVNAIVGMPVTINTSCTNGGAATALNASCAVTGIPAGASNVTNTCNPKTAASLTSGAIMDCTITFTPVNAGTVTITTTAGSNSYDPDPSNNVTSTPVIVSTPSALAVVKSLVEVNGAAVTAGYLAKPGDTLRYLLTVTNSGGTAGSTTLTETVSAGTSYVGIGEGWSTSPVCLAARSNCTQLVTIAAAGSVSAYFTVKVADILDAANIVNTLASSEPGSCGANCVSTTPTQQADVAVTTPPSLSFKVGDEVKVVSTCSNVGPVDTTNASCVVSGAPNGATTVCVPMSPVALLAVGATITCTTSFKATEVTSFVVTTTASHALYDPVMANNVGATTVVVGNAPIPPVTPVPVDARWAWVLLSVLMIGVCAVLRRRH
ncbi:MAG: hypothetical protein RSD57_06435 [Comamonas sp.]